jgi:putative DNA-invertase from lambdoid prophage Rac
MRAAIYARVSTLEKDQKHGQERPKQDPERQSREMREHTKHRGWKLLHQLTDRMSATKERPALQELWKLCRARKVDVVLVHEFSRFARSTVELLRALEEFQALGIQFVSLKEQIDTTTPAGKLVFTVIAAICEFERSMIRERVKSGMAHARAKGVVLGRKRKVLDTSYIVRRREQGATWGQIAAELEVSPDTCQRAALRAAKSGSPAVM